MASKEQEPMRLFGNSFEDYYTHGMDEYPVTSRALLGVLVLVVGALTKIVFPWKVEDAEPYIAHCKEQGTVIVQNHCSALDPVFTIVHLWFHGVHARPVYKSEFDKHKAVTWLFSRVGGFPVSRGESDMNMVRWCRAALQRGESILIFPEGTRIRSDAEPYEIHGGFALLAQLAKTDVTPIAIVGSRNIRPVGAKFPKPTRIFLKASEPIAFSSLGVRKRKEQIAAMEKAAWDCVLELRGALRVEHPGKL